MTGAKYLYHKCSSFPVQCLVLSIQRSIKMVLTLFGTCLTLKKNNSEKIIKRKRTGNYENYQEQRIHPNIEYFNDSKANTLK